MANGWYVGRLVLAAALSVFPRTGSAQTVQSFDTPGIGTPYALGNHIGASAPGASLVAGGPTGAGQFLRLAYVTPVPSHNSITFNRTGPAVYDTIVAEFDFRLTRTTTRADGLGFAFLSTGTYNTTGAVAPGDPMYAAEEPAFTNSLGIGFDIYKSGISAAQPGGEVSNDHISIHFNKVELTQVDLTPILDLASGQWIHAQIVVRAGALHDVSITLTPAGGVPVTVVNHFVVMGLTAYDGRVHFAGRSGGESADHDLDNVNVQFPTPTSAQLSQNFDAVGAGGSYVTGNHIPGGPGVERLPGGPSGTGHFLRLAHQTPVPSHGSVTFDRIGLGGFDAVVAEFDFRLTPAATRADGLGFAFLSTAQYGTSGAVAPGEPLYVAEEPSFTGSLGVGFDIYQSGASAAQPAGEVSNNHVSIHFNKVELAQVDLTGILNLASGTWIHAQIVMRPGSGFHDVSVVLTPAGGAAVTAVDRLAIPGFHPYEGRVHFAARAGGESAHHDIDNVTTAVAMGTAVPTLQTFDVAETGTPFSLGNHIGGASPGPTLVGGGPTGSSQALRLVYQTPTPTHNSVAFNRTQPGAFDVVMIDFDFRMASADTRADGLGFALLNTGPYGTMGAVAPTGIAEEPNFTGSLGIGFDIYKNADIGDPNNNHVSIHYDGTKRADVTATESLDLASGRWIHARLMLRPGGAFHDVSLTLTPDGGSPVTLIDHLVVAGFLPYEGRLYFAARAGGESANVDVDNVDARFLTLSDAVLSFTAVTYRVMEGTGTVQVGVSRAGATDRPASVQVVTENDTALVPADYLPTSAVLTFAPGEVTKTFTVPIVNDLAAEGMADEAFFVALYTPAGAAIGGPSRAAVWIGDDDTARTAGRWSPPVEWPVVAIHLHLLPTGKVLFWEGSGQDDGGMVFDEIRSWDPVTGAVAHVALPGDDIFCSGHSLLADGRLLVTGGHMEENNRVHGLQHASAYNPFTNTWAHLADMNDKRWYPTNTALANGDALVVSGDVSHPLAGDPLPTVRNWMPQVWQAATSTWRNLDAALAATPAAPWATALYPRMFLAPDGRVFKAGPDAPSGFMTTAGSGAWVNGPPMLVADRDYGSAAMFDGRVAVFGGGGADGANPPTNTVEVIDLRESTPAWTSAAPMLYPRRHHNATLLPTGEVLITSGTSSPGFNNGAGAVLPGEIWNPQTGVWTATSPMTVKRVYHSTALLLPDGRVVVAGSGQPPAAGDVNHRNAEIFSPPYLFKGPRPVIASAPSTIVAGQTFAVASADAASITAVRLIRLGSVTHAFDQNQRLLTLPFTTAAEGVNPTLPNTNMVPPGHYMLFLVNGAGVPSVAWIVQVTGA